MIDEAKKRYDGDMPGTELVKGKCSECGDILMAWEEGWQGENGEYHLVEVDMGGGRVDYRSCGPVWRI